MTNIIVYYYGIVNVLGMNPNWSEPYDPNKTIGDIILNMKKNKLCEENKKIEIFKYNGNIDNYNKNNMYWSHDTSMNEYVNHMGFFNDNVRLIYFII